MKKSIWVSCIASIILLGCQSGNPQKTVTPYLQTGLWRALVQSPGGELPFGLQIEKQTDSSYTVYILNGAERLPMDDAYIQNDSIHIPMNLFSSQLVAQVTDSILTGYFIRQAATRTIKMGFSAQYGRSDRFVSTAASPVQNITGKWDVTFYSATDTSQAVGVFEQKGKELAGTFLTPTGDYRYLVGSLEGKQLQLSTFDGSHVYLFKAQTDSTKITGQFWSGDKGYSQWIAIRNEKAALPDANTYTQLKKGYTSLSFAFPDPAGKMISLADEKYKGKVVIVQILGSWCPNCMDETSFLAPWYQKNRARGIEIIGLAFEPSKDLAVSGPKLNRMKKRFNIAYDVTLAGVNNETASQSLPMLEKIKGYPTTIFIDKHGTVRRVHTGFSGPGTGSYYEEFVEDFNLFVDKLLTEK